MRVRIGSRIRIDDPSDEIIEWAEKNLRFANPEYIKKERMGFWLGRTPRELQMYEWNGNQLILPFGVCRELMPMLGGAQVECEFQQDADIEYGGDKVPLYDYQETAVKRMLEAKYGILKSTTGSGKTQMGIAMIKALRKKALWLCHTQDLLNQSRSRAMMYMDKKKLGTITEGKVNAGEGVTFATVQTMANLDLDQYKDWWDVVIVDECHRVASSASTFTRYERVLNHLAARHKYGLTATPERSDGLIQATFALLGKVMYEVPEEAVADRVMGVKIRPVNTGAEISEESLNPDGTINYTRLIGYLTANEERNKLIVRKMMEEKGHSFLILSERLEQLVRLMLMLPYEMQEKAAFVNGKMTSKRDRALREQWMEEMRTGEKLYLFASYSLAKEGLDIPRLDRLFLASPCKYSAIVTQAVGRIRRTADGKETPVVIDFIDREIGFCEGAWRKRKSCYRQMGAEIETGFLK